MNTMLVRELPLFTVWASDTFAFRALAVESRSPLGRNCYGRENHFHKIQRRPS